VNTKVRLSAIVTCHNYGRYLARCLESLRAQTLPLDETILVDDSSMDETSEVASGFKELRVLRIDARSPALARQAGFEASSGDFVVMVDADDWLDPHFAERLIAPLLADARAGFSYCGAHEVLEAGDAAGFPGNGRFLMRRYDRRLLLKENFIPNCALIRRAAWLGQNPQLEALEDWEHWLRVTAAGWQGVLVPEKLFYYRMHDANATRRHHAAGVEETAWAIRNRYAPYEMTLLALFTRPVKGDRLRAWMEALETLELSHQTQRLFVNNTGESAWGRQLKSFGAEVLTFPHPARYSWRRGFFLHSGEHTARLLRFSRPYVLGRQLLVLEPGELPEPGLLRRLQQRLNGAAAWSRRSEIRLPLLSARTFESLPLKPAVHRFRALTLGDYLSDSLAVQAGCFRQNS